jgi:L-cysteine desulfidase
VQKSDCVYNNCLRVLNEELLPAFGCTEPIAVAYAAALARDALGEIPASVSIACSGNIIKNVKSVIVPNSGNLKGLQAAASAGIIAGRSEKKLELLTEVTDKDRIKIREYLNNTEFSVKLSDSLLLFDIVIEVKKADNRAVVRIANFHTNVVLIQHNDKVILSKDIAAEEGGEFQNCSILTVERILDFADSVDVMDVKSLLDRQISCNMAIAKEGLRGNYGANIGSVMLCHDQSLRTKVKAMAAAGSDARMSGLEMTVIINSGSGNQGIAVCVPIVEYAREKQIEPEKVYRALVLANLLAIYQRSGIGCLSAYCGAINAGVASACGIAYLEKGTYDIIAHTLVNGLAIASGVICDGAKASCASKIVVGIEAGLTGYDMYRNGQQFYGGDGIVKHGVEETIASVARLGRYGMQETDKEILKIMIGD